jgi:hypothetical protein
MKTFHSMAFQGFPLRKNLVFLDQEPTKRCLQENRKMVVPGTTLLFIRVL